MAAARRPRAASNRPCRSWSSPRSPWVRRCTRAASQIVYGRRPAPDAASAGAESMRFCALGWSALAISLLSPVDEWTHRSFALHMVQHELLMIVAAPLFDRLFGRPARGPGPGHCRAARSARRRQGAAPFDRSHDRADLATLSSVAWVVHALALWLCSTCRSCSGQRCTAPCCTSCSTAAFWPRRSPTGGASSAGARASRAASSIASLFTTMLHTSALGALLTFSQSPWYGVDGVRLFGLSALEDQATRRPGHVGAGQPAVPDRRASDRQPMDVAGALADEAELNPND